VQITDCEWLCASVCLTYEAQRDANSRHISGAMDEAGAQAHPLLWVGLRHSMLSIALALKVARKHKS